MARKRVQFNLKVNTILLLGAHALIRHLLLLAQSELICLCISQETVQCLVTYCVEVDAILLVAHNFN